VEIAPSADTCVVWRVAHRPPTGRGYCNKVSERELQAMYHVRPVTPATNRRRPLQLGSYLANSYQINKSHRPPTGGCSCTLVIRTMRETGVHSHTVSVLDEHQHRAGTEVFWSRLSSTSLLISTSDITSSPASLSCAMRPIWLFSVGDRRGSARSLPSGATKQIFH
jgi:hypothetical protein